MQGADFEEAGSAAAGGEAGAGTLGEDREFAQGTVVSPSRLSFGKGGFMVKAEILKY